MQEGEFPAKDILGNPASGVRSCLKLGELRKARREDGSTTSTMIRAKTTPNTAATSCSAAFGARREALRAVPVPVLLDRVLPLGGRSFAPVFRGIVLLPRLGRTTVVKGS